MHSEGPNYKRDCNLYQFDVAQTTFLALARALCLRDQRRYTPRGYQSCMSCSFLQGCLSPVCLFVCLSMQSTPFNCIPDNRILRLIAYYCVKTKRYSLTYETSCFIEFHGYVHNFVWQWAAIKRDCQYCM